MTSWNYRPRPARRSSVGAYAKDSSVPTRLSRSRSKPVPDRTSNDADDPNLSLRRVRRGVPFRREHHKRAWQVSIFVPPHSSFARTPRCVPSGPARGRCRRRPRGRRQLAPSITGRSSGSKRSPSDAWCRSMRTVTDLRGHVAGATSAPSRRPADRDLIAGAGDSASPAKRHDPGAPPASPYRGVFTGVRRRCRRTNPPEAAPPPSAHRRRSTEHGVARATIPQDAYTGR